MKSNYLMLVDLEKVYSPKNFGFISADETELILNTLCIKEQTDLGLQNLRDFIVLFYSLRIEREEEKWREYNDKMSAICCVIDNEKWARGIEV